MIIKSFIAESSAAALKRVREEMGGDAIVLKTRQITGRGKTAQVEVTACIESPTVAQASAIMDSSKSGLSAMNISAKNPVSSESAGIVSSTANASPLDMPPVNKNDTTRPSPVRQSRLVDTKLRPEEERLDIIEQKLDSLLQAVSQLQLKTSVSDSVHDIIDTLKLSDVPESLIRELLSENNPTDESPEMLSIQVRNAFAEQLASFVCDGITLQKGDSVLFVGPSGAGKTSVMGKLAAQVVAEQKLKVKLAGLDYQKVAAYEELAVYADLLDIEFDSAAGKQANIQFISDGITLIDAPAMPVGKQEQNVYREAVNELGATYRVVVFSALTRSADIVRFAELYKQLQPTQIIMSMFDQTHTYGSAVTAAKELEIPIAYISDTPGGIGTLKPVDLAVLTPALLNMENGTNEQA